MFVFFTFNWLNNLHHGEILDSVHRVLDGSDGFYFRLPGPCDIDCVSPEPSVANAAFDNVRGCAFLSTESESSLQREMMTVLKKVISHPEMFEVSCEVSGRMKSFRFEEALKQKDKVYVIIAFDTTNCELVRIDNFCEFADGSELLRQMRD